MDAALIRPPPSRAQRLVTVGRWLCGRSPEQACRAAEQAVALAEAQEDWPTLGQALNLLGTIEMDLGLMRAATHSFQRGQAAALRCGDLEAQLKLANNAGILYSLTGDLPQAAQQFELAQMLLGAPGLQVPPGLSGMVRVNLASIYNRLGDSERVLHLLDALDGQELQDPVLEIYAGLARAYAHLRLLERGQPSGSQRTPEGERHLAAMRRALDEARAGQDRCPVTVVQGERASLEAQWLIHSGQPQQAEELLRAALAKVQGEATQGGIQLHLALGNLLTGRDPQAARQEFYAALALMDESGLHIDRPELLEKLAGLEEESGHLPAALSLMRRLVTELRTQEKRILAPTDLRPTAAPADDSNWQERLRIAEMQARIDPLTGLYNRRALDEVLPGLQRRLSSPPHNLYALLLDIDHFKQVNDTYSHAVGDQVLRRIAGTLQKMAVQDAFAARYGGEELLLIVPDTSLPEAQRLAESLRAQIEALRWPENKPLRITVSVGLTNATPQDTLSSLLARADRALYQAKNAGRNQVVYQPAGQEVSA